MSALPEVLPFDPPRASPSAAEAAFGSAERLARERFVDEVDEGVKAEFIDGVAIVHSPARLRHSRVVSRLDALLMAHVERTDAGIVAVEKAMISLSRNDYEPDVVFFGREKAALLAPDQLRFPAPDFVVEVLSESTESRDRGIKLEDYAAHGVIEYWIVDPVAERVERYVRSASKGPVFERAPDAEDGILRSVAVPGFEIAERALFERAAFVEELARIAAS